MNNMVGTNGDFFKIKVAILYTVFLCFFELLYTIFNTIFGYKLLTPQKWSKRNKAQKEFIFNGYVRGSISSTGVNSS
jgi:hypothetical protein